MADMNLEQARHNMVEQQIRPWDVLDGQVLDSILQSPREDFVPTQYRNLAFTDMELPIGHGEVMMSPKFEARMLQTDVIATTPGFFHVQRYKLLRGRFLPAAGDGR